MLDPGPTESRRLVGVVAQYAGEMALLHVTAVHSIVYGLYTNPAYRPLLHILLLGCEGYLFF
jgi:hypothetical protein